MKFLCNNRRQWIVALAVASFALTIPSSISVSAGGTPDDCGDSPFSNPCVINESQINTRTFIGGNIEEPGDLDVFQFEVKLEHLGQLFLIETIIPDGDPFSDTYLRLIDLNGITEIVSDNDSGAGSGSKILWSPTVQGNYYAEVTQFFPDEIGLYQISVFRVGPTPGDDHGNTYLTATEIQVGSPPASGSTELSADVDYFKFLVEANQLYDIETGDLEPGSDTVMTLFSEDGMTRLETDDQGGREFNASRIVWVSPDDLLPGSHFFYVEVQQFLTGTSGVGYSLSVSSSGSPQPLPLAGAKAQGQIGEPGGIDSYIFSASQMATLTAHLKGTTGELNLFELRLLDHDGVSVLKSQKNLEFEDLQFTVDEADDYFLLVTEEFEGGDYTLSATIETIAGNPDLNMDGKINHKDLLLLIESYQSEGP